MLRARQEEHQRAHQGRAHRGREERQKDAPARRAPELLLAPAQLLLDPDPLVPQLLLPLEPLANLGRERLLLLDRGDERPVELVAAARLVGPRRLEQLEHVRLARGGGRLARGRRALRVVEGRLELLDARARLGERAGLDLEVVAQELDDTAACRVGAAESVRARVRAERALRGREGGTHGSRARPAAP